MREDRIGRIVMKISGKRTTLNWLFFVIVLVAGRGGLHWIIAGIPFIAAGEAVRTLAAGTIKKNEVLTTDGPYGICRHPLYLGSFLIAAGFVILSRSIFVLLFFFLFFPLAYIPAVLAEESFLTGRFGDAHLCYKKQVPLLIPAVKKIGFESFSWRQAKKNGEHLNWVVVALLIIAALIKSDLIFNK